MEIWILATLFAAAVQTVRFALQKRLKGLGLSTGGATLARFVWAVPIAWGAALWLTAGDVPPIAPAFWPWAMMGGLGQIVATFATITLFSLRSFAVGIAFTKTETIQVAAFSAMALGEAVSGTGLVAILLGVAGVIVLSRPQRISGAGWITPATGWGLLAGGLFGISAIGYRGATLAVQSPEALTRAMVALAAVTLFQTIVLGLWLMLRERGEVVRVARAWRATLPVGITGVLGSAGWFWAFALQNAAYVRSLGQIELIFSLLISVLWFRERPRLTDIGGMALLALSIVGIVWAT
ncbi:MAG: DMT family transporter [Rhodobacteraceae bacterium]|jgi:drug/metabolite transporter (DMT)-like permease|nr:DMT family transporter [Paracoccaceae bacterium]MCF8516347.1 DMT family transporter [Paracoccaceae bacterium]MCF8520697.1 DMT family transporter [Paracoccaceae bacterium]